MQSAAAISSNLWEHCARTNEGASRHIYSLIIGAQTITDSDNHNVIRQCAYSPMYEVFLFPKTSVFVRDRIPDACRSLICCEIFGDRNAAREFSRDPFYIFGVFAGTFCVERNVDRYQLLDACT